MRKHPNLLPEIALNRPEKGFVSDITCFESDEGMQLFSLVTDAYSRKIMSHELSSDMKSESVAKEFAQAVQQRCSNKSLLHYSDRGLQHCSAVYQQVLRKSGVRPSMEDGYDCYQNALAERLNGILKQEFLLYRCKGFEDLRYLTLLGCLIKRKDIGCLVM